MPLVSEMRELLQNTNFITLLAGNNTHNNVFPKKNQVHLNTSISE
jgi:hypothetical protein